jgi:predicted nucleotidyltransferase
MDFMWIFIDNQLKLFKNIIMQTSLSKALADLSECYGLTAIYVFGSQAVETALIFQGESVSFLDPERDVDIGIQPFPGKHLSAQDRVAITQALEELFRVRRVDLVLLPEARPFLALDIIKGELLYCNNPDRQAEDELYVLRRAGDLAYYEEKRRQQIINRDTP